MSAIGSGLSIIIPLYILALHGSVLNVGLALAAYNLVSIPSSLLWGKLTDSFGGRKSRLFILSSILGVFPILLILGILSNPHEVEAMYGLYALIATAASPSINILVMGTKRDPSLPKFFSRYSMYIIVGSILAEVPGLLVSQSYILYYLYFLLVVNAFGMAFAWITIKDTKKEAVKPEQIKSVSAMFPILNMLSTIPNLLTGHALVERLHKVFDGEHRNVLILLVAIALFNGAMNLFNTSYIPYLKAFHLSYSFIFAVSIVNSIGQLAVYISVAYILSRNVDLHRYYGISVWLRGISYMVVLLPLIATFIAFLYVNILGYALAGIAYAMWNIAASVMLYDHVRGKDAGYYIGIWVAVLGLSAVLGSLFSGILSSMLSYTYTFTIAAMVTFASAAFFSRYHRSAE